MTRRAHRSAHGRPLPDGPAPFTTLVQLTFEKRKVEHWIRFGRKSYEQIIDRRRSVVGFAPGVFDLAGGKPLDLRGDEMRPEVLCNACHRRIRDDRNLFHVLVMVMDESQVGRHRPETVPPRKMRSIDDQAGEVAALLDLRVDGLGERGEIGGAQRGFGMNGEDRVVRVPVLIDHDHSFTVDRA